MVNDLMHTQLRPFKAAVLLLTMLSFLSQPLLAVRNRYYDDENAQLLKEMRDSVDDIRHEVNNHETEMRIYDEKMKNIESIIEGVRDQLSDSLKAHKEQWKGSSSQLEASVASLEATTKGLIADLRQFKAHANETSSSLAQCKQKMNDLEKAIDQQSQNIEHLQTAMRSLVEAMTFKETASAKGSSSGSDAAGAYRVKAGDNLEKIARLHQTTVAVIKDLNGLSHDRISIGQVLRVPDK